MRRAEQAEASRAALVAAARSCFVEHGYDATTVAEVLRRAGMARGALYHYFPGGKDELFAAVYVEVDDELYRRVDRLDTRSPLAALRASADIFLRLCLRDDFARITVLEGPRVIASGSPHGTVLGRAYDRMRAGVAAAIEAGELVDVDVDVLTTALYGAVRDLGARVAAAPSRSRRRTADEALVVLDRILDGVTAGPAAVPTAVPTAVPSTGPTDTQHATNRRESA